MSATQLARLVAMQEVTCEEVMRAVVDQIQRVEPSVNAFASFDGEGALAEARSADRALQGGAVTGPLHGIPVTVKDLIDVAGFETGYGSWLMEGNIATADAVAVGRLREAGAIIIGKTTTPEFAGSVLTESERFGVTRNPWDLSRTPGGSSGGAGAVVAAGCAPLGLATDGAGSARIPASCCGVLGLKPTLGRIPNPQAPDLFANFTHLGIVARAVDDVAMMLGVLEGPHPGDPWSVARAWPSVDGEQGLSPTFRAFYFSLMGNARLDSSVDRLCRQAVNALASPQDVRIDDGPPVPDWGIDASRTIMRGLMSARMASFDAAERSRMGAGMRRAIAEGERMSAEAMKAAPLLRSQLFRTVESLLEECDLLLSPTLSAPPPAADFDPVGEFAVEGEAVGDLRSGWFTYPTPFNLTGHPAISVPVGFTSDGLPVGLQAVAGFGQEALLLDVARALQQHFDWCAEWPVLAI